MKFSDIPHFMLKEYIYRIQELSTSYNELFLYKDTNKVFWDRGNLRWVDTRFWSPINAFKSERLFANSYLMGPKTCIRIKSNEYYDLYIQDDDRGFIPVMMRPTVQTIDKSNYFYFDYFPNLNNPVDDFELVELEGHYQFKIYDLEGQLLNAESGVRIYLRNDSGFHQWLMQYGNEYFSQKYNIDINVRNYINTNKPFIYIGTIHQRQGTDWYIWHYDLWNYVVDIIPPHQQTEKLKDFIYLAFDVMYNETYNSLKDVWSLIDPLECHEDILDNLLSFYGTNVDDVLVGSNEFRKRWLIHRMISLLQQKGTYSGIYNIWKILTKNNNNRLNVYERWYDFENITYLDWLYTSFYNQADYTSGAGDSWYREYFNDISYPRPPIYPGYENLGTAFHNLNSELLLLDAYDENWNKIKLQKYKIINNFSIEVFPTQCNLVAAVGTETDADIPLNLQYYFEKERVSIKDEEELVYDKRIAIEPDYRADITYPSRYWHIEHELEYGHDEALIVNTFDEDGNEIFPDKVELIDNTICTIDFLYPVTGYVLLKIGKWIYSNYNGLLKLSNEYVIEADLTTSPVDGNKILTKETIDSCYNLWESFNPINRAPFYKLLLSPITDLTTKKINLYKDDDPSFAISYTEQNWGNQVPYTHIAYNSNQDRFYIQHDLNSTDLFVELYHDFDPDDEDKPDLPEKVSSDKIRRIAIFTMNIIDIELTEPLDVWILIKNVRNKELRNIECDSEHICFPHSFNTKNVIAQFFKDNHVIYPESFTTLHNKIQVKWPDWFSVYEAEQVIEITEESSEWNITHNLGYDALLVDVYNDNDRRLVPETVTINSENDITIEFSKPVTGRALILPIGTASTQTGISSNTLVRFYENQNEVTINHNLNSDWFLIQIYDENMRRTVPKDIVMEDKNNIKVTFSQNKTFYVFLKIMTSNDPKYYGKYSWTFDTPTNISMLQFYDKDGVLVIPEEYTYVNGTVKVFEPFYEIIRAAVYDTAENKTERFTPFRNWNVLHNFNTIGIITNIYDNSGRRMEPKNIVLLTENSCVVEFDTPKTGYVLSTLIGNLEELMSFASLVRTSKLVVGNEEYSYEFNVRRVRDTRLFVYVEYRIPTTTLINPISFMKIIDINTNEVLATTDCSDIYKSDNFEMNIFYKFSKRRL